MKKLLFFCLLALMSFSAVPIRSVSSGTTIQTSDNDGFVVNTGGDVTFVLGTVSAGFNCVVANHGSGLVTFSQGVTVGDGKTLTILSNNATEIVPDKFGNTIRLWFDGSVWRGL